MHSHYHNYGYSGNPYWTPGVRILIIANGIVFAIQMILILLERWGWWTGAYKSFSYYFALAPEKVVESFWVWQLITSVFLHGDALHIVFNLLMLYFFGFMLEKHYGTKRFLVFFIMCGIFASLVFTVFHFVWHTRAYAIGASGAIMGVLMIAACLIPHSTVFFMFLFPLKMRTLIWILIFIDFYSAFVAVNIGVAATAHLGGLLFGYLYFHYSDRILRYFDHIETRIIEGYEREQKQKTRNIREEVDRLLDKIHQRGMHSLTAEEREFLQKASKEYPKDP